MSEWRSFSVGKPSTRKGWFENTCKEFDDVSHVAHVETASDIVRDGLIKAGLVFDKSTLNKDRILVTWLSPNDWSNGEGFRYGNVRFRYDFRKLVAGKKFYWVEKMDYQPIACRILVTNEDRSNVLESYDPEAGDGPWWYDRKNDKHYFNGDYCLEIMYESGLHLADCVDVDFVVHHPKQCCIDHKTCKDKGKIREIGGAEFISSVMRRNLDASILRMNVDDGSGNTVASIGLRGAAKYVLDELNLLTVGGNIKSNDPSGSALGRAVVSALFHSPTEAESLAKLFATHGDLQDPDPRIEMG